MQCSAGVSILLTTRREGVAERGETEQSRPHLRVVTAPGGQGPGNSRHRQHARSLTARHGRRTAPPEHYSTCVVGAARHVTSARPSFTVACTGVTLNFLIPGCSARSPKQAGHDFPDSLSVRYFRPGTVKMGNFARGHS